MQKKEETIIVGGGMAGMFCAMKLKEAGKPFLLITEHLGGRVCYKPEFKMNFGAVFYFENYHNVKPILTAATGLPLIQSVKQIMLHNSEKDYFPAFSFRMLKNVFQLLKFKKFMNKFVKQYEVYKKDCEVMQVKDALKKNPLMNDLFYKSAPQLIAELGINEACTDLVSKFVFGCTGSKVHLLTALDFCNCAQGLVMPIYQFTFNEERTKEKIGNVLFGTITDIQKEDGEYVLTTKNGDVYTAKNLVMATPAGVTKKFLNLPKIREASVLFAYLVKGKIKEKYAHHDIHCFSDTIPIIFIANRKQNDEYEVFSNEKLNLDHYFDSHQVLCRQDWPEALYTHPALVLDQDMGDNLYMAGDHNGLGMEPAAISGIYAANKILERVKS